jgi:hypothetical protein
VSLLIPATNNSCFVGARNKIYTFRLILLVNHVGSVTRIAKSY